MELIVLDQTPAYRTDPAQQEGAITAVRHSVQLARDCEQLGWDRYWIAEHHELSSSCGSPEILVAAIAASTSRIRVGAGAVLLPHYTPLKVATTFNLLERLYPHRIDLGIGRGPGGSPAAISRLASLSTQGYSSKIVELLSYLHPERLAPNEPTFLPHASAPQVLVNGSSAAGAAMAAAHGLPFVLAQFVHEKARPDIVDEYRDAFRPVHTPAPIVGLGMWITCVDDADEAARLRAVRDQAREGSLAAGSAPSRGELNGLPRVPAKDSLQELVGTPAEIEHQFATLLELYRPDLLAVSTYCPDYTMRLRSYELVRDLARQSTMTKR